MIKRALFCVLGLLSALSLVAAPVETPAKKPVLIILYSRFYDHTFPQYLQDRFNFLLPQLERLSAKYPQAHISSIFQFSGTTTQVLDEGNEANSLVGKLHDFERRGLIEFGYTGEDEPSYLHRPRANDLLAETPQERWAARAEAAERFLTDFKNPVTGDPVPGLTGGLKRTQETFGEAALVTGIMDGASGDSPVTHQLKQYNRNAILTGIPIVNPAWTIAGFGFSATGFSKSMSPADNMSPEVFWEDGMLRISDQSLSDVRRFSTDEGPEALKKALDKMDRSRIRVIKIEYGSYLRYLSKRADGSVIWDPMQWVYYHPDQPKLPDNLKAFAPRRDVDNAYKREEAALKWLAEEFFPANPGSRFVSAKDLKKMAGNPVGSKFSSQEVRVMATDLLARFSEFGTSVPSFTKSGDRYLSTADAFDLLTQALAGLDGAGAPQTFELSEVNGPLELSSTLGVAAGQVSVAAVIKAAGSVALPRKSSAWTQVPKNAIPAEITVDGTRLNAGQFLRLMAEAYIDPQPDKKLPIKQSFMLSHAAQNFPMTDGIAVQGNTWTFRPAPLRLEAQ